MGETMPETKTKFLKRVERFLNANERMTTREANKLVRLLKDARNEITQAIKNVPLTEWQMYYLPQLREQLNERLVGLETRLVQQTTDSTKAMFEYSVNKADELSRAAGAIELPRVMVDPEVLEATQTLTGELIKTVPNNLRGRLGNRLALGLLEQKSAQQVAREMVEDFKLAAPQADRIARTELLRTQSLAQEKRFEQIVELDPAMKKAWKWSGKPGGRTGHAEAEATYMANPIPFDEPFMVAPVAGGRKEPLQFPRDPAGSPENTINCGCVHLLVRS